jgi:hypothetical protein
VRLACLCVGELIAAGGDATVLTGRIDEELAGVGTVKPFRHEFGNRLLRRLVRLESACNDCSHVASPYRIIQFLSARAVPCSAPRAHMIPGAAHYASSGKSYSVRTIGTSLAARAALVGDARHGLRRA